MQIEIRKGLTLQPGTFSAVISPEPLMVGALNSNADLQRFLFLFISGNYSRILNGINRRSGNFDVCRAFTAHQLLDILRNASHTIVFVEHDPTLFDEAWELIEPIGEALKQIGRESLVILYTPSPDRAFSGLTRRADRYIEIVAMEPVARQQIPATRVMREYGMRPAGQLTLDVS